MANKHTESPYSFDVGDVAFVGVGAAYGATVGTPPKTFLGRLGIALVAGGAAVGGIFAFKWAKHKFFGGASKQEDKQQQVVSEDIENNFADNSPKMTYTQNVGAKTLMEQAVKTQGTLAKE